MTIDYLSQLERSGVREAESFIDRLKDAAAAFGAALGQRRNPIVIGLETSGPFDRLQASEVLRLVSSAVDEHGGALRGVSVYVHDSGSVDEAVEKAAQARYADPSARLFGFSREAIATLSDYFPFDGGEWVEPYHATRLADADASRLLERPRLDETIERALSIAAQKGHRLVHIDSGPGPLASGSVNLARLAGPAGSLALRSGKRRPLAYSPLVEAIAERKALGDTADAQGRDDGADLDAPAFDFALSSSYAGPMPPSVARGCEAFMGRWLDAFGDGGGIVVCEDPGAFPAETLAFIADRLSRGRGSERYLSLRDGGAADELAGPWAARVPSAVSNADDREAAVASALGALDGETRRLLAARFGTIRGLTARVDADPKAALGLLPKEAALYLCALASAGNGLSAADLTAFVGGLGLRPAGERLLIDLLKRAGFVSGEAPSTPIEPFDPSVAASAAGPEKAAGIDGGMSDFIVGLYRSRRVRPSLGLLRRVGERADDERLLYDCLFEDSTRRRGVASPDLSFLSRSSSSVFRFWSALSSKELEAATREAAAVSSSIQGARAEAVKALVAAETAYGSGRAAETGKAARSALLALGKGAPPKLETRSQRMMGLSSLALGKHAEASDYFTNAQELSELAGDEYERTLSAYAKAVVEFLWGALVRAGKALDCAYESATRIYDSESLAAVEALRGRIELELGSYTDAAERFEALSARAAEAGLADAARRASIWRGRAEAYAGDYVKAADLLEAETGDREADSFRGELEILRGRPRDARRWLDVEPEAAVRPFCPPDSFDWSSLFAEIEGRSIGFDEGGTPLSTFRRALSLFAKGLDERDPACAVQLHSLSRSESASKADPNAGTYSFFCYLLEERLAEPPVDKQTVLSRAFKTLQQRAGRIEDRSRRSLYMERNAWNGRLLEAARTHKFI